MTTTSVVHGSSAERTVRFRRGKKVTLRFIGSAVAYVVIETIIVRVASAAVTASVIVIVSALAAVAESG